MKRTRKSHSLKPRDTALATGHEQQPPEVDWDCQLDFSEEESQAWAYTPYDADRITQVEHRPAADGRPGTTLIKLLLGGGRK